MKKKMMESGLAKLIIGLSLVIVLTLGGLQLRLVSAQAWTAPTLDGKLDNVYREYGAVYRDSNATVHEPTGEGGRSSAYMYLLEDQDYVYVFYHQDMYFENDNSYGPNSIHWEARGNGRRNFQDIWESDLGEFTFVDGEGSVAAWFNVDQLSADQSNSISGYSCLGFSGGDGSWLGGYADESYFEVTSVMDYNLNKTGYCVDGSCACGTTTNLAGDGDSVASPLASGSYRTTEPECGDWQWYNGWEMRVDKRAFGVMGFGVVIGNHHNSPTKGCHTASQCRPIMELARSSIGDRLWHDINRDGLQEAGEPGLSGVTVKLIDPRDGRLIESQVTGADGNYLFEMLSNNTYIVQVDETALPTGFSNTNVELGDFRESYVNNVCGADCLQRDGATYDRIYYVDLDMGQDYRAADFGYAPGDATEAVIGDTIWSDADDDGAQERGEPGIGGVTLQLLADNDGDGNFTDVVATIITADDGSYLFTSVAPDTYAVRVVDSNFGSGAVLDGYTVTSGPQSPGANITPPLAVGPGDAYLSADFGYDKPGLGSIGNTVWYDVDNDGQQAGEAGAANVTVDLYLDSDGDGEIDGGEAVIATEVTDADGAYLFVGLKLDAYYLVRVSDWSGVLDGLDITTYWGDDSICSLSPSPGDPPEPYCDPLDLDRYNDPVPVYLTTDLRDWPWADFGYNGDGSIGDSVWYDWDKDGVRGPGETSAGNVQVQLLNGDGSPYDRDSKTTGVQPYVLETGSHGRYLFTGVPAADYKVDMTLPADYLLSPGTPDNPHDSDGITLHGSQSYLYADFGLYHTDAYTVGDTVWCDTNANGVQDANESGIAGVTLVLIEDTNGDGVQDASDLLLGGATTDGNGNYTLYGVIDGGHYLVGVTDGNGVLADYEQTAGLDPWSVTISGASREDIDFGYVRDATTATLGDTVWYDTDGDGAKDVTERGIGNVSLALYWDVDGDGNFEPGGDDGSAIGTTATGGDGTYVFAELAAGYYFVQVDSSNFGAGEPLESLSSTTGGETHGVVALGEGQAYLVADFGYRGSGYTIGDTVWSDEDTDGVQDRGEIGIGGVTVQLLDNNNQVIATTATLPDGWYLFSGLSAASYKVRVSDSNFDSGEPLEGYSVTSGPQSEGANTSRAVEFVDDGDAANDSILSVDFGYYRSSLGSIGDYVWLDKDLGGDQDADEPGLTGVTLDLIHDLNGDGVWDAGEPVLATTVTAEDGDYRNYQFTGLDLDDGSGNFDYLIRVSDRRHVLEGLSPTSGTVNPRPVALSSVIRTVDDADFGYDDPELGDFVWRDTNQDGIQNGGESGIGNVRVDLYHDTDGDGALDPGGDSLIRTTTTNANGRYYFCGLPFDDYIIKVAGSNFEPGGMLEGFTPSLQDQGDDDAVDSDGDANHEIATTPLSAKDFTLDFGFQATSHTIGDLVWEDADKDGLKGGSEFGLGGVTLVLYRDLDGDDVLGPEDGVLGQTTTSGSGAYAFSNLPTGDYIVRVTDDNNVLDGYTQTAGGDPQSVTLSDGDDLTVDFGYWRNGGGEDDPTSIVLCRLSAGSGLDTPTMSLVLVFVAFCVWMLAPAQRPERRTSGRPLVRRRRC